MAVMESLTGETIMEYIQDSLLDERQPYFMLTSTAA